MPGITQNYGQLTPDSGTHPYKRETNYHVIIYTRKGHHTYNSVIVGCNLTRHGNEIIDLENVSAS